MSSNYHIVAEDRQHFPSYKKHNVTKKTPKKANMKVKEEEGKYRKIEFEIYLSNIGERKTEMKKWDGDKKKSRKVLDEGEISPQQLAERNLQNLLRSIHRCNHPCFVLVEGGVQLKKCMCVAQFARMLREEETTLGLEQLVSKWVPKLEPYMWVIVEMRKSPTSLDTLMCLLEIGHPFSLCEKQNRNCDWMINLGGSWHHFCLSSSWEFDGYFQGRRKSRDFMKRHITSMDTSSGEDSEESDNTSSNEEKKKTKLEPNLRFFRNIVLYKGIQRKVFKWCADKCIKTGHICFMEPEKKEDKVEIAAYFEEMKTDGLVLNNKEIPMDKDDPQGTQRWWRPAVRLIRKWTEADFLIIAHPQMMSNNLQDDPTLGAVVFNIPTSFGNAGTISVAAFKALFDFLNLKGFRNKKFFESSFQLDNEEDVVLRWNTKVVGTNALIELVQHLTNEETVPDTQPLHDLLAHIVSSCEALTIKQEDWTTWTQVSVLVSRRKDYTNTDEHFAQTPLTGSRQIVEQLAVHKIIPYLVTIPLTEDGCWLRVYPEGMGTEGEKATGKMVYVPFLSTFIQPITTTHGGGFRTSFNGNRRIQIVVYLVPKDLATPAQEVLPQVLTWDYSNNVHSYKLHEIDAFTHFCKEFGY